MLRDNALPIEQRITIVRSKFEALSPTFCSARYLQCHINLATGTTASCHHTPWHTIDEAALQQGDLHNTQRKKANRKEALDGKRPADCDFCWRVEDAGSNTSDRILKSSANWAFKSLDAAPFSDSVFPTYLEVAASNVCNMQCAYCEPRASSLWMEDYRKNGAYTIAGRQHNPIEWLKSIGQFPRIHEDENPYVQAFREWFPKALPNLRTLRFTGGEPTLSKAVWEALRTTLVQKQAGLLPNLYNVAVNTNLMASKQLDALLDMANEFAKTQVLFEIFTSCDAWGEDAEKVRGGLHFPEFWNNVMRVHTETKAVLIFMISVNVFSARTLHTLLSNLLDMKRVRRQSAAGHAPSPTFALPFIRYPEWFDVTRLSPMERVHFVSSLEGVIAQNSDVLAVEEHHHIRNLIKYLLSSTYTGANNELHEFMAQYEKRKLA